MLHQRGDGGHARPPSVRSMFSLSVKQPQRLSPMRSLLLSTEPEKEKDISFSVTASQRGAEPLRVANHLIYSWKNRSA